MKKCIWVLLMALLIGVNSAPLQAADETDLKSLLMNKSDDFSSHIHRLAAIEKIGRERVVEFEGDLIQIASDSKDSREVRREAMVALGKLRSEAAIPLFEKIVEALKNTEQQSAWGEDSYIGYAIFGLGQIGTPKSKQLVLDAFKNRDQLKNLDSAQLMYLIEAVGGTGDDSVLKDLFEIYKKKSYWHSVHDSVVIALERNGSREAIRTLFAMEEYANNEGREESANKIRAAITRLVKPNYCSEAISE